MKDITRNTDSTRKVHSDVKITFTSEQFHVCHMYFQAVSQQLDD